MKVGSKFIIHGYKHNGKLYKTWDEAIYIGETDEFYVFGNNKVEVSKSYGQSWRTKDPAVLFFFKNEWFNVIAQLKKTGLFFYCNIASPVIIEEKEKVIKFIDYDLDLRIFPDGTYKILDKSEYELHKRKMNYSKDLDEIINYYLLKLVKKFNNNDLIFDKKNIDIYSKKYFEIIKNKKN